MRLRLLTPVAFAAAAWGCTAGQPAHPGPNPSENTGSSPSALCAESDGVTIGSITACMSDSKAGPCFDALWAPYLQTHTTQQALALLQCFEDTNNAVNVGCHPIAHGIGRDTFAVQQTVDKSFAACDQTCHSGCYHGAMERFLRGDGDGTHITFAELQQKAASACDPNQPTRFRFQCLHGLGHALMYYSGYALKTSLSICDSAGDDWSKSSCWGGVFMENIAAADPTQRDVSPTDVHYPCDAVDDIYKGECYVMQTSRMAELGLTPTQILAECKKTGAYEDACSSSLGRDMSDVARRGDPRTVSSICEQGDDVQRPACTRGCVYALSDNTWDPRWVFPFCRTFPGPADAISCYQMAIGYLESIYVRTPEELRAACGRYASGDSRCIVAFGQ
jgi:hypothetical protein